MRTAGVAGLGLVGGSLARDLAALGWRVQGDDPDPAAVAAARAAGVIEGGIRPDRLDLLVLAAPVPALPGLVRDLAPHLPADAVATDVGSAKRGVVAAVEAAGIGDRFVPAHPVAGDHRRGWAASRRGLFRGATVWVCPARGAEAAAVARVEAMWRSVGGRPGRIDAATHDARLARSSHLPQLAASALALVLADAGLGPAELGPGGHSATRLAASDPGLWTGIAAANADEIAPALAAMAETLGGLERAVRAGDEAALAAMLTRAAAWAGTEETTECSPDSDC